MNFFDFLNYVVLFALFKTELDLKTLTGCWVLATVTAMMKFLTYNLLLQGCGISLDAQNGGSLSTLNQSWME